MTALPSTGGTVHVDLPGSQSFGADVFTGVTKSIHLISTSGTYALLANQVFPKNITIEFKNNAKWSMGNFNATIRGTLIAPKTQVFVQLGTGKVIFDGDGSVVFNQPNGRVDPRWWGADFSGNCTDGTSAVNAALASLNGRGGTVVIEGYFCSDAPSMTGLGSAWVVFEVTGRWDWNTQLLLSGTTGRMVGFVGKGGGTTNLRQTAALSTISMGTGFASTVPLMKQTSAGAVYAQNIAFVHNKNAPVYQCVNGAAFTSDNVNFTNNNSGAAAHVIELDGCFWMYFTDVTTNTAGATGSYNYHITGTTASTQDPGLTYITRGQMNNSGVLLDIEAGRPLTGAFTHIQLKDTTMEGGTTAYLTIDLTNNPTVNHIVLDSGVNADSVAATDAIEIIGTPTSQNAKVRDVFLRNSFAARPVTETTASFIQNLVVEGSHSYTGGINLSTQRDWALQIGAFDGRWLYAGGQGAPSWVPFATPNATPAQDSASWNGYVDFVGTPTVTGSILDPFGGTGAFRITSASGTAGKSVDFDLTTVVGDWIVVGAWLRSNTTTDRPRDDAIALYAIGGDFTMNCGNGFNESNTSIALHTLELRRFGTSTGWFPAVAICKIATVPANPGTYSFRLTVDNTKPTEYYKPFLIRIPASLGIPDGDIIRAWRAGAFNNIHTSALANEIYTLSDAALVANTFKSRVATGTAPLVVASTTNVANLNASSLGGATMAAPGAIGGTTPAAITGTTMTGTKYATATNCASSGGTCGSAAAGAVTIAAAATTVTVSTTAVNAASRIFIFENSTLGTELSVTCNTTIARSYAVTTVTAATSFVITASASPVTNPACLTYVIVN